MAGREGDGSSQEFSEESDTDDEESSYRLAQAAVGVEHCSRAEQEAEDLRKDMSAMDEAMAAHEQAWQQLNNTQAMRKRLTDLGIHVGAQPCFLHAVRPSSRCNDGAPCRLELADRQVHVYMLVAFHMCTDSASVPEWNAMTFQPCMLCPQAFQAGCLVAAHAAAEILTSAGPCCRWRQGRLRAATAPRHNL
jgi:Fe2+ transport system protein FeoA